MNTKRILSSLVTGIMLTGSLALAARGDDQPRAKSYSRTRVAKPTTSMTTTGAVRTRNRVVANRVGVRTGSGVVATSGDTVRVRSGNRVVTRSYPYRTYGYRRYSHGYPYYSYGPSVSFGFGYPYYSYGFGYPYDYYYGDYPYGSYPSNYTYGYYGYSRPGYTTYGGSSIVITVQSRLARAGYYHGPIDGIMGPATSYAIRAYERNHGLRADGAISGQLLRNMGLRS